MNKVLEKIKKIGNKYPECRMDLLELAILYLVEDVKK